LVRRDVVDHAEETDDERIVLVFLDPKALWTFLYDGPEAIRI
jgi:hypothetical protein